jgi:hypothetical protein
MPLSDALPHVILTESENDRYTAGEKRLALIENFEEKEYAFRPPAARSACFGKWISTLSTRSIFTKLSERFHLSPALFFS